MRDTVHFEDMPQFINTKKGPKKKYPWLTMLPGYGFKFESHITLGSARSQVANAMRTLVAPDCLPRKYVVRIDGNNELWCIRIDHMDVEERERWRRQPVATAPAVDMPLTDEEIAGLRPAGPHAIAFQHQGKDNPRRGEIEDFGTVDPGEDDVI